VLVLKPVGVVFAGDPLEGVVSIGVDRVAGVMLVEHDEAGKFTKFADAAQQRVVVTLTRSIRATELGGPRPGDAGELVFEAREGSVDGVRSRVTMSAVVERVTHRLGTKDGGAKNGGEQTIRLEAVSGDGQADPVAVELIG